ncbi:MULTISPECIES: TIGR02466 family protein [unclassified Anabaena]|uniref:TIGR02466 family protein n=1 Tax=unclassified Anabaena TaxID=2619674 RepID=UPI00083356D1|nr:MULTISPECIES: TIGR02466 family protein [unclassified Anabaena]
MFEHKFQNRLFFTPIYGFKLNLSESYIAELIHESHQLYREQGIYQEYRSTRDAFQSKDDIHHHPLFKEFFDVIVQAFSEVVCKDYQIEVADRQKFFVKKAWVNVNPTGGYNVVHNHPNAFFSGVYYLQADQDSGEIAFLNPVSEQGLTMPHELIHQSSIYTSDRYFYSPRKDLLLLFPSYINHYVHPNKSSEDRICVAFNIGR